MQPQWAAFALIVTGIAVITLMILGCVFSSTSLMGAAVILGVPFFAVLVLGVLHNLERTGQK